MLALFIAYPWATAVPGIGFLLLYPHCARRSLLVAGVAWLLYGGYEYAMKRRLLCSGECNIRVDLLLIYSILLVVTLLALVTYLSFLRRPRAPTRPAP
jgi:hypothetical protein